MKEEKLFEAMADIDEKYIAEADIIENTEVGKANEKKCLAETDNGQKEPKLKGSKHKKLWLKWVAMAACLCIIILGVLGIRNVIRKDDYGKYSDTSTEAEAQKVSVDEKPTDTGKNLNNSKVTCISEETSKEVQAAIDNGGVYIPAVELPAPKEDVEYDMMDMMGLIVYNGGIYTQASYYSDAEAEQIEGVVGDYLGYAKGNIDEWSAQDEYATEFSSSVPGNVYEVKGYDKSFRICMVNEYQNEMGNTGRIIEFFDRLNGITLNKGEDLFDLRLKITENIKEIRWQSHEDWDYARGNYHILNIEASAWEEFWKQVKEGAFIDTWDPELSMSSTSVYDISNQVHLFIYKEDGTNVELRMIEGGYVGYQPLGWYFVKIPGDAFDAIFAACRE